MTTNALIVQIPFSKTLKETLLENKKNLLFGSAILVVGLSIGMPIGAFIYDRITNAALASCPFPQESSSSLPWEATTLTSGY